MNEKHLVLDFNKKDMKLSLNQVAQYDIDAIYDNIDKFKRFMTENIVSDCFQKDCRKKIYPNQALLWEQRLQQEH